MSGVPGVATVVAMGSLVSVAVAARVPTAADSTAAGFTPWGHLY